MKQILLALCCLLAGSCAFAQVSIRTNLPHTIALNRGLIFDVKIRKGQITNFSKFQMELPEGMEVKEVESKTGSFTFEENKAKIVWVITPTEPEFAIRMRVMPIGQALSGQIVHRYYYIENDEKKELEMEPFPINFKDTVMPVFFSSPFETLKSKTPSALLSSTLNPAEVNTKKPGEIIQQVTQLRKDSKEAFTVGEKEKAMAETRLADANTAIQKADSIGNEEERRKALEQANEAKLKAENELETASRVITLAKTLEENANEIERINKSINPAAFGADSLAKAKPAEPQAVTTNSSSSDQKDIETLKNIFKEEPPVPPAPPVNSTPVSPAPIESGLVYRVQVGAFSEKPPLSSFKGMGKASVVQEDGKYKVLIGSYKSKEEALKKRAELGSTAAGCFVVSYQDGVRVR